MADQYLSVEDYKRMYARGKDEDYEHFTKRMFKAICSTTTTPNEKDACRALLAKEGMSLVTVL